MFWFSSDICSRPRLPETRFEDAVSDALLDLRHRLAQLFGDGLAPQRLHVKVVGSGREDEEGHHRRVRTRRLKKTGENVYVQC